MPRSSPHRPIFDVPGRRGTINPGAQVPTIPLTVTIDQAVGQDDPTAGSPILFDIVFSEAVTGFTSGDVTITGTANADTVNITGSGPTYQAEVSGMANPGTVIADIDAGVATALSSGLLNSASTSIDNEVTYTPNFATFGRGDAEDSGFTSEEPTWVVPTGVTEVWVWMEGARGGYGSPLVGFALGGAGARFYGLLPVTPGETLYMEIGGHPDNGLSAAAASGNGGWPDAGNGARFGTGDSLKGFGGGGSTRLWRSSLGGTLLGIAAGGGGARRTSGTWLGGLGDGGEPTPGDDGGILDTSGGPYAIGGGGATDSAGGAGGQGTGPFGETDPEYDGSDGSSMQGGDAAQGTIIEPTPYAGGGGGGLFGGGGGAAGGSGGDYNGAAGGGGSSDVDGSFTDTEWGQAAEDAVNPDILAARAPDGFSIASTHGNIGFMWFDP